MLCVSLFESDIIRLIKRVEELRSKAELLEIRLDALYNKEFELSSQHIEAIKQAADPKVRLLFTNRLSHEGGAFKGDESTRVAWLKACVDQGVDFIDVELNTSANTRDELIEYAQKKEVGILISNHDFQRTPHLDSLIKTFDDAVALGPDIIKIVTTPNSPDDLITIMNLYPYAQQKRIPLIAFAMGDIGKITRIFALDLGAPFTYCAPPGMCGTAPGQLDLETIRDIFKLLSKSSS